MSTVLPRLVTEMKEKHSSEKQSLIETQKSASAEIQSLQSQLSSLIKESEAEAEAKAETVSEAEKQNRKLKQKMTSLTRKFVAATKLQEETEQRLEDVCVAVSN